MDSPHTLQHVSCSDWEAFYFNGDMVAEGHTVPWEELLLAVANRLGASISITHPCLSDETVEAMGYNFPKRASELPE